LDVGSEAAGLQPYLVAAILAQHALRRARLLAVRGGERAGVAAIRVVRAADERPARARGLEAEPPFAAGRAEPRVSPVRPRRVEMRREEFVDLLQHLADPEIGGLGDGGGEVAPEAREHLLVVAAPGRDVVKLLLQV